MHSLCLMTECKMLAISITRPFRYEQLLTRNRCCAIIGCTWITDGLIAIAHELGNPSWDFETCTCASQGTSISAAIAGVTFGILIPVIVIVPSTVRIIGIIIRTHRQIAVLVSSIGGGIDDGPTLSSVSLKSLRSGRNVLLVIVCVVCHSSDTLCGFRMCETFRKWE